MADPFAAGLGTLFRGPRSVAAVYVPIGGIATPITVIRGGGTRDVAYGQGTVRMPANMLQIRRSDIAEPAIDDLIEIGDDTFRVSAEPELDTLGLTWMCEADPA